MFYYAYYSQVFAGADIARRWSHPSKVSPMACINIVVDCMRVEPAKAMYPTLQFILFILSLKMNYFER